MIKVEEIEGLRELRRQFQSLGVNFPKAKIRKAVNQGTRLPLFKARQTAPKLTGALKKGIIKVEEPKFKANKKLKKVVNRIVFDRAKNSIFQKPISEEGRGRRGGQGKPTAYYPVSQEYGWAIGRSGERVPGKYFIKKAIEQTTSESYKKIIDSLSSDIDKIVGR